MSVRVRNDVKLYNRFFFVQIHNYAAVDPQCLLAPRMEASLKRNCMAGR